MAAKKDIISALLDMLNDALETKLDLDPCMARNIADINKQRASDTAEILVTVVGSSHVAQTLCMRLSYRGEMFVTILSVSGN
jgi:hypothetical protein